MNASAVSRVFVAKGRADGRPVPVLIPDLGHVLRVAASIPGGAEELALKYWPGPLTLVLPKRSDVPIEESGGKDSVGVRVPDHALALRLLHEFGGAITGTSANRAGEPPMKSSDEVKRILGGRVDVYIDFKCGPHNAPSTVVDFTKSPPQLIREGAVSLNELERVIPDLVQSPGRAG